MDLEKKIKEFEESCLSLASNDSQILKEEINNEIEEQMKVEIAEYTARKEWNFKKTIEKLEKSYMKEIFACQTECKKQILKARDEIELDLKRNVIKKLEDYVESENYKNYLLKSISDSINAIENEENITIGITKRDLKKYKEDIEKDRNFKIVEIDNNYIGGCTIKTPEIYIDNTLLNNLNEKLKVEKE